MRDGQRLRPLPGQLRAPVSGGCLRLDYERLRMGESLGQWGAPCGLVAASAGWLGTSGLTSLKGGGAGGPGAGSVGRWPSTVRGGRRGHAFITRRKVTRFAVGAAPKFLSSESTTAQRASRSGGWSHRDG